MYHIFEWQSTKYSMHFCLRPLSKRWRNFASYYLQFWFQVVHCCSSVLLTWHTQTFKIVSCWLVVTWFVMSCARIAKRNWDGCTNMQQKTVKSESTFNAMFHLGNKFIWHFIFFLYLWLQVQRRSCNFGTGTDHRIRRFPRSIFNPTNGQSSVQQSESLSRMNA